MFDGNFFCLLDARNKVLSIRSSWSRLGSASFQTRVIDKILSLTFKSIHNLAFLQISLSSFTLSLLHAPSMKLKNKMHYVLFILITHVTVLQMTENRTLCSVVLFFVFFLGAVEQVK